MFFKQKTVPQRCHNLLFVCKFINIIVIVRLTTAVDNSDDNATDMCSVRAAASWALIIHIISKENKWQIQAMMAVTHEQFSVPHGHKIITQFINKVINEIWGNMKAIVPAEQEAQTSEICKDNNIISVVVAGDFGCHRCTALE